MGTFICKYNHPESLYEERMIKFNLPNKRKNIISDLLIQRVRSFDHHDMSISKRNFSTSIALPKGPKAINSLNPAHQIKEGNTTLKGKMLKYSFSDAKYDPVSKKFENSRLINIDPSKFVIENRGELLKFYDILEYIGKGCIYDLYKVRSKINNEYYAIQCFSKSVCQDEKIVLSQIEIMKKLDHPNIIKIIEYFLNPSQIFIVIE